LTLINDLRYKLYCKGGVALTKRVDQAIGTLSLVEKNGGRAFFQFKKKKGSRVNRPPQSWFSIVRIKTREGRVHVIVAPGDDPARRMSIDGSTMVEKVECGSSVHAL
jgi:hypothetical protein